MKKELAIKGKKTNFEKKTVGIVSVVTGDKVAKLTLLDDGKKFKSSGSNSVKVKLASLPKFPKIQSNNDKPIELRVRMNEDDTEVEAFGPVRGMHEAELIDLGPRQNKDSDPVPYKKWFHKGEPDESFHHEFFAVYRITKGFFKGCEAPYYLHYKFEEDEENEGMTQFSFNTENPRAKRGQQLLEWGYIHGGGQPGIWGEPISWDDETILPELLERCEANLKVNLVFDKGYVQSIQPLDDMGEVSDDELDVDRDFPKDDEIRKPPVDEDDDDEL